MSGMVFGYLGAPSSTAVVTGSYTIPAGYFAVVSASCADGGSVSIGGTTGLHSVAHSWSALSTSPLKYDTTGATNSLNVQTGASGSNTTGAFVSTSALNNDSNANVFTAAEGTVINGSGTWAAIVSLYPKT